MSPSVTDYFFLGWIILELATRKCRELESNKAKEMETTRELFTTFQNAENALYKALRATGREIWGDIEKGKLLPRKNKNPKPDRS